MQYSISLYSMPMNHSGCSATVTANWTKSQVRRSGFCETDRERHGQTDNQWMPLYQQGKLTLTSCPRVQIHYYCTGESESLSCREHRARRHDGRWVSVIFLSAGFGGLLSMGDSSPVSRGGRQKNNNSFTVFRMRATRYIYRENIEKYTILYNKSYK